MIECKYKLQFISIHSLWTSYCGNTIVMKWSRPPWPQLELQLLLQQLPPRRLRRRPSAAAGLLPPWPQSLGLWLQQRPVEAPWGGLRRTCWKQRPNWLPIGFIAFHSTIQGLCRNVGHLHARLRSKCCLNVVNSWPNLQIAPMTQRLSPWPIGRRAQPQAWPNLCHCDFESDIESRRQTTWHDND